MARDLLSATTVDNLKLLPDDNRTEVWHHDGGGLYLRLRRGPRGLTKDWILRYSHPILPDKRPKMGLGTYPEVSLANARRAAADARELLAKGIDPQEHRERAHAEAQLQAILEHQGAIPTTVSELWLRWRDDYLVHKHADGGSYLEGTLTRHVLPVLGDVRLADLRAKHIISLLDGLRKSGLTRTCGVALDAIRQMAQFAVPSEWLQGDPTVGLQKSRWDGYGAERDRWLSNAEIQQLAQALALSDMPARWQHAIWLILACGTRVEETMLAEVQHFTLDTSTPCGAWCIPAANQKKTRRNSAATDFEIVLSPFALAQVEALIALSPAPDDGKHFLFPGRGNGRHANEKTLTHLIEDRQRTEPLQQRKCSNELELSRGPWSPHDLRRTMSTGMGDLRISSDAIDLCQNHTIQGKVRRTYQRSQRYDEMSHAWLAWGAHVAQVKAEAEADPEFQQRLADKLAEDRARSGRYAVVKARRLALAAKRDQSPS